MTDFDRPGLYVAAGICFALVLIRCWWLVAAEVRAGRLAARAAEAELIAALLRRNPAPAPAGRPD